MPVVEPASRRASLVAPVALRRAPDPPGGLQAGRVGGRVGVLALLLGPLLQPAAGLPYEGVDAVDRDAADVAVVGEVLGARERHGGDGEMGEAVQEAVRRSRRTARRA